MSGMMLMWVIMSLAFVVIFHAIGVKVQSWKWKIVIAMTFGIVLALASSGGIPTNTFRFLGSFVPGFLLALGPLSGRWAFAILTFVVMLALMFLLFRPLLTA